MSVSDSARITNGFRGQAAVLLALKGEGKSQHLLLTRRAMHLNIHRGEVAFPGGKWEEGDTSLLDTALRESNEEVALNPECVEILGQLEPGTTGAGMRVTPFVGAVPDCLALKANLRELDALFWVPVAFLATDIRVRTDIFVHGEREVWAPVYQWEGYTIWGFTARVIVSFLNSFIGAGIRRENVAEEVVFQRHS